MPKSNSAAIRTIVAFAVLLFTPSAFSMPICGTELRVTCVVDGDTVWINREKIRLMDIDAPEVKSRCLAESALAAIATRELQALLSSGPIKIERHGQDHYGRTLTRLTVNGRHAGSVLVAPRQGR